MERERASAAARLREACERYEAAAASARARVVADWESRLEESEAGRREERRRAEAAAAAAADSARAREAALHEEHARCAAAVERHLWVQPAWRGCQQLRTHSARSDALPAVCMATRHAPLSPATTLRELADAERRAAVALDDARLAAGEAQEAWKGALTERLRREAADAERALRAHLTRERDDELDVRGPRWAWATRGGGTLLWWCALREERWKALGCAGCEHLGRMLAAAVVLRPSLLAHALRPVNSR